MIPAHLIACAIEGVSMPHNESALRKEMWRVRNVYKHMTIEAAERLFNKLDMPYAWYSDPELHYYYVTNPPRPCKRGHEGERSKGGQCLACRRIRSRERGHVPWHLKSKGEATPRSQPA